MEKLFSELEKMWRSSALKDTGILEQKKPADILHAKITGSGIICLFVKVRYYRETLLDLLMNSLHVIKSM